MTTNKLIGARDLISDARHFVNAAFYTSESIGAGDEQAEAICSVLLEANEKLKAADKLLNEFWDDEVATEVAD